MSDDDWRWCPFGEDGKGAGCIILIRQGVPHAGPHEVVESEDDDQS